MEKKTYKNKTIMYIITSYHLPNGLQKSIYKNK